MESAFKEGFFDMMEANFDNLQETATNALKIIQRAMAATLFDMVKMPIMGAAKTGMDSLFKNIFGPSGATKTTPTTGDRLIPDFGVAKGGAFTPGGHYAFEKGGVVDRPTYFRFAKGKGLMGEAGPEAVMPLEKTAGGGLGVKALSEKHGPMIMPLKRMPDGDLGVQAQFAAGGVFGANETLQPNPQMEAAQQAAQPAAGSGGDVKVIINNHTGEKVEAKESRGPSGNRELEVMIGNALMKDGPASRALQQTYGLSRRGVMRG
jgi:phage-related minor tail protein